MKDGRGGGGGIRVLLLLNGLLLVALVGMNIFHYITDTRKQITTLVLKEDSLVKSRYGTKVAVVVPFTAKDMETLNRNIQSWKTHLPCESSRGYSQFVEIAFYFNKDLWNTQGIVKSIKQEIELVAHCFSKVKFMSASLGEKEDRYPQGPTNMFFKLLKIPNFAQSYSAMYYMEPDNFPCRAGWLDKIYEEAVLDGNFWMKGSIIRDGSPLIGTYTFAKHLNGNALFRLDSPQFIEYLASVEKELKANPEKYVDSYDIAIYLVRENRDLVDFPEYAATQHLFVYTEFIQNWYRTEAELSEICARSPATFLVHGRNLKP